MNGLILIGGSLMLALTRSRSAMVVVSVMLLWQYRKEVRRYKLFFSCLLAVGALVLLYIKFESAMGRIILWWQSVCIWLEHPVC